MSFVRPELVERLRPWREALVWGGTLAAGLVFTLQGVLAGAGLLALIGLVLSGASGALLAGALRRGRLREQAPDEGIVRVMEARIGYFGPRTGGFVDLDSLERVDMVTDGQRASWWLVEGEGTPLRVPVGARGADGMYDALSAHFPLDEDALKAALATRRPARFPLWVRTGESAPTARLRWAAPGPIAQRPKGRE